MKTEFEFYDENKNLNKANLILSFEHNDKKYVIYDLEEEKDTDTFHVREYEEVDSVPYLYMVSESELAEIAEIMKGLLEEIEE